MKLQVGDWVEVRSKEEILRTLNSKGQVDGLPFMPQMFQYCGQRFKVFKRAHKTCDTVNQTGGRRMSETVHLDLRCDGEAYGGCQAVCLLFWKTTWLKSVSGDAPKQVIQVSSASRLSQDGKAGGCPENVVWHGTHVDEADGPRYTCQATLLPGFTRHLPWWDLRQYLEDYTAGNVTLGQWLRGAVYATYFNLAQSGLGLGRPLRWFYDQFQSAWGGLPYPKKRGIIPVTQPTPTGSLDLQPGELVRVKPYGEILATLNTENKNRGLYFDSELVPFCGNTYRVKSRLHRFIDEKTGKMISTKSAAILLENVWCQGRYSDCRMFCPRAIHSWWREIWLERVEVQAGHPSHALFPEGEAAACSSSR